MLIPKIMSQLSLAHSFMTGAITIIAILFNHIWTMQYG